MGSTPVRAEHREVAIHLGIVGLPPLVADLVAAAFAPGDDVEVELITAPSAVRLENDGDRPRHDVIIVGVGDPWRAHAVTLLSRRPDLVLIGFASGGRDAWIYELQPTPRPLGQLGPALLRQTVFAALAATHTSE
jgi:hypothetical protein